MAQIAEHVSEESVTANGARRIPTGYPARVINASWYEPRPDAHSEVRNIVIDYAKNLSTGAYPASMWSLTSAHSGTPCGWHLWFYDKFADLEIEDTYWNVDATPEFTRRHQGANRRMGGGVQGHVSTWMVLRDDLSYRVPIEASEFGQLRFIKMDEVRLKPGRSRQFEEYCRGLAGGYTATEAEEPMWVYELYSGGPTESFQIWTAYRDISQLDLVPDGRRRMRSALGDDGEAVVADAAAASIDVSKTTLFGVNPGGCYQPNEVVSTDPTFWSSTAPPWP